MRTLNALRPERNTVVNCLADYQTAFAIDLKAFIRPYKITYYRYVTEHSK